MKCYEIDLSNLLKITRLDKSEFKPPQKHITRYTDEYILYVIEKGTLCIEHNGEKMELLEGDVCLFNKGEFQRCLKATECNFYYIHFQTQSFFEKEVTVEEYCHTVRERKINFVKSDLYGTERYDYIKVLLTQRFNIKDKSQFAHIINILKNNTMSLGYNTPEWRINICAVVTQLLMRMETACMESLGKNNHSDVYDTVKDIADYIEFHFKENFGSNEIESDLHINFDYANRIFKKHMGISIIKYRNKLRINAAKRLILEKPLNMVATELGFVDRYYFSRCFKSFEDISPDEYKRIHKQERECKK